MEFQGFQNILPALVIFIAIIGILILSWYSYRKITSIPALPRWGLITLRATALIILLLLLMNPYFYSSKEVEVKPKLAVFLDNTESVSITKGDYQGEQSYNALLNSLNFDSQPDFDIDYYSIGENTATFNPDSLSVDESQTNLSLAVNTILELEDRVKAGVIISDGIITYGKDPSFAVSNSSFPLFTIGLGDTARVKDISVSNVLTNAKGYTNTNQVIEAEISQSGFPQRTVVVSLMDGNEVVKEQNISFETENQVKKLEFEIELSEAGLKQYQIKVNPVEGEWTEANNQKSFSIDVLDSRVKILHVAFQIHPDVKMLRAIISEDANNELTTLTWLGGSRFVEELPQEMDFNLVIIHGIPTTNSGFNFLNELSQSPTIFLALNSDLRSQIQGINQAAFIENNSQRLAQVILNPLLSSDEQPIMELPDFNPDDLPTLYAPLRSTNTEPQSQDLFSAAYEDINTESPVISVMEQGNTRRAHINAWGWYRFYQNTSSDSRQLVTDLFSNIVSWTSSNPDNRSLQITPEKQTFTTNEVPGINASLQNESGAKESEAIVEVRIISEDGNSRSFNMANEGNGNYQLDLPKLSEGLYEFEATARKGNREIDQQKGEFIVSNSSTELTNTTRNDQLLKAMAANTNGNFFSFDNTKGFWDSLRVSNVFEAQKETIENYSFPVRSVFWFVVVLILLGTEWLLRKYYSLP